MPRKGELFECVFMFHAEFELTAASHELIATSCINDTRRVALVLSPSVVSNDSNYSTASFIEVFQHW